MMQAGLVFRGEEAYKEFTRQWNEWRVQQGRKPIPFPAKGFRNTMFFHAAEAEQAAKIAENIPGVICTLEEITKSF